MKKQKQTIKIEIMKTSLKLFALGLVLAGFGMNVNAQSTANATGSATVIIPISIAKTTNMSFGNLAVTATAGTVVLAPAGTRTATAGVTLPNVTGTVTAAAFNVTGEGTSTYSISLPSSYTLNGPGGATMVVDTFTSNPGGTGALTAGAQTISVGATLNVNGSQAVGSYVNAEGFPVTVNYN